MENLTKQQATEMVNNSVSSIFSKDDVLKLIQAIVEPVNKKAVNEAVCMALEDLQSRIDTAINNLDDSDIVDMDSIELSIGHNNKIEVDRVSLDYDAIITCIENEIDELANNYGDAN